MKKLIVLALAFAFFRPALLSQGGAESQVMDLEKQGVMAALKNDSSFTQSHFAEDYVGVGASGQQTDKQTLMDNWKSGKTKYEKLDVSDRKLTQYAPDVVVVRGKATVKGMVNGKPMDGTYAFTRMWVQRDGKWLAAAFQSSKLQ